MESQSSAQRDILGPPATVSGSAVRCGSLPHQHSRPQKNFCSHISARCDLLLLTVGRCDKSISTLTSLRDVTLFQCSTVQRAADFYSHISARCDNDIRCYLAAYKISTLTSLRDVTDIFVLFPAGALGISTLTSLRDVTVF